jgi:DNA (cytosine-5)-methyltransferase 1
MKTVSLFSGIGGIDLGLERLGWDTVAFSEFDPKIAKKKKGRQYAAEVMAKRFPDAVPLGDITALTFARNKAGVQGILRPFEVTTGDVTIHSHEVAFKGDVDVISGGFPCQDISYAGKGAGIQEGTRSGLWRYFHEAIAGLTPRGAIIENVAALSGRGLDRVLHDLAWSGYDAEWDIIPAAAVGAPHLRERMFILAWPHGKGNHGEWPTPGVFDNWLAELPDVPRLTTEDVPNRPARLRCLGNAVVPQAAAWVGHLLADRIAHDRDDTIDVSQWDSKHGRGDLKGQSKEIGWAGFMGDDAGFSLPTKLPRAGRMTAGWVIERPRSAPRAHATKTGLQYMAPTLRPRADGIDGIYPTPVAQDDNKTPEAHMAMKAAMPGGPRSQITSLQVLSKVEGFDKLVPTPTAKDADSSRSRTAIRDTPPARESQMGETLTDYVDPTNGGRLLPTPKATDGDKGVRSFEGAQNEMARGKGGDLDAAVKTLPDARLLPTPRVYDAEHRGSGPGPAEAAGTTGMALASAVHLLPTPTTSDGGASDHRAGGANLEHQARLLPTMTVADANGSRASKGSARPDEGGLQHELRKIPFGLGGPVPDGRLLPTPIATDGEKVSTGTLARLAQFNEATAPGDVRDDRAPRDEGVVQNAPRVATNGRLYPDFVEWLMGVPIGWTDLDR